MAAKFRHQLLGAFLTILVLQPFVSGQGSVGWNNLPLTYGFLTTSSLPEYLDLQVVTSVIDAAFQVWQVAVPKFEFRRIYPGENANIKIAFTRVGSPAYGIGYPPPDGRLYIDNNHIPWSTKSYPASNELDLMSGLLHLIGDTLGLGDSTDPTSVMYHTLTLGTIERQLSREDITRIQALY